MIVAPELTVRAVIPVGPSPVQLCLAADGERVVALGAGGSAVSMLDGQTAEVLSEIDVGPSPWNALAQGARVYVAMHTEPPSECVDSVQVVDATTARLAGSVTLPPDSRSKLVIPAFERARLYSLNWGNGTISEIDTESLTCIRSLEVGGGPQYGQRVNGMLCIANGRSNDVAFVDEATFTVTGRATVGQGPERCVIDRARDQVYTSNLNENTLSIVDITRRKEIARVPVASAPFRITPWDSRGRAEWAALCRGSRDEPGAIVFIDAASHQVTDTFQLPGTASNWNWGLGPKHQTVYVTLNSEPLLLVIDALRLEILQTIELPVMAEPAGVGPGIYNSKAGGVFVATRNSVTLLSTP